VKDKSVVLEEYATRLVSAEAVHLREMEFNKEGKSAISVRVVSARGGGPRVRIRLAGGNLP
jgi:hypothetical protein